MLRHDQGTIAGFETGDFASLVYKIALLIFIGGAVLALFRERIAEAFQAAMFWVVIGLLLAVGYTYRHDLRDIGERVLAELMPGRAVSRGAHRGDRARPARRIPGRRPRSTARGSRPSTTPARARWC